ncbi:MAG TPA: bifunctional serine/threonine-protein kinase/formylglycine-generating enzyme family protein [Blastocatellia bacterium]|nr:bifunctional serine/threonine-protein kinase/formylglycine-generating enzyme family protein [Blastocatellia bacterium]
MKPLEGIYGKFEIIKVLDKRHPDSPDRKPVVYLALNRERDHKVALKVIDLKDPDWKERLDAERDGAELQKELFPKAPYVARVFDYGILNEQYFYIEMEYIDGETLEEAINSRKITPRKAVEITIEICSALEKAHYEKPILHCDISATNVMISRENQIRILDFGIAKRLPEDGSPAHNRFVNPGYAPRERLKTGGLVNVQSDLWSVSVLLCEMVTGEKPYVYTSDTKLWKEVRAGRVIMPPEQRGEANNFLREIIEKGFAEDPKKRYQTASDMIVDLNRFLELEDREIRAAEQEKQKQSRMARKRRVKIVAALSILGFLLLAAASGWWLLSSDSYIRYKTVQLNDSGDQIAIIWGKANHFSEILPGNVVLEMIEIKPGALPQDAAQSQGQKGPTAESKQEVSFPTFHMSQFEITQAQWRAVVTNAQATDGGNAKLDQVIPFNIGDDLPVDSVLWEEAQEFCNRLARLTGRPYRLPTQDEWEYACRAGTHTDYAFGNTITPELVNFKADQPPAGGQTGAGTNQGTRPVGSLGIANAFGLYDMHGNVWEWCQDVLHDGSKGATPKTGNERSNLVLHALRGGSWFDSAKMCSSTSRGWFAHRPSGDRVPSNLKVGGAQRIDSRHTIGFRVVVVLPPESN